MVRRPPFVFAQNCPTFAFDACVKLGKSSRLVTLIANPASAVEIIFPHTISPISPPSNIRLKFIHPHIFCLYPPSKYIYMISPHIYTTRHRSESTDVFLLTNTNTKLQTKPEYIFAFASYLERPPQIVIGIITPRVGFLTPP